MKTFSSALLTALANGDVLTAGAVKIEASSPFRVWSGYGDLTIGGETYAGIGQAGLIRATGAQLGGAEQALELSLSGVDPDVIPLLQDFEVRNAAVTVWRLMFDGAGTTLLGSHVFARGRVDGLPVEETPGGSSTIRCRVETAARGMGRATGRSRADADQRRVSATDGGFQYVTGSPGRELAWGGKPPARAGQSLPNALQLANQQALNGYFGYDNA